MRRQLGPVVLTTTILCGCVGTSIGSEVTTTSSAAPTTSFVPQLPTPQPTEVTASLPKRPQCPDVTVPGTSFAPDDTTFIDSTGVVDQIVAAVDVLEERELDYAVNVVGHSDSRPSDYPGGNDALSVDRAKAVELQLIAAEVPASKVTAWGVADTQPVPGAPEGPIGDEMNRRVEITVICEQGQP